MPNPDAEARFTGVVRAVIEPLRRYLYRRTDPSSVDDLVGDVLLVCWRRLDDVPVEPLPWVYGVARRCLANARRADARRAGLLARLRIVDPPAPVLDAPRFPGGDHPEVREALASLRDIDAEVLRLWAWEELPPAGIATVLGVSENAAAVRLHRARDRLRRALEKTAPPPVSPARRPDTSRVRGEDVRDDRHP